MNNKIFISYSSQDQTILNEFVDKILKLGLNVKDSEIKCTGIEGSGIKTGDDFKSWIKNNINDCSVAILLISRNYKTSEVCLNEMGAIWALNKSHIPIIVDPIGYENAGFIHNTSQLLRITSKDDLLKLRDENKTLFKQEDFNSQNYNRQIDSFLKLFDQDQVVVKQKKKVLSKAIVDNYFNQFLIKDVDYLKLFLKSQPTISDCRSIFTDGFSDEIFAFYNAMFFKLIDDRKGLNNYDGIVKYDYESSSYSDIVKGKHKLQGGMKIVVELSAMKGGYDFYNVRFLKEGDTWGIATNIWCYINDRWVFFPKPWKIIREIDAMKNSGIVEPIAKIVNRFGIGKELNKSDGEIHMLIFHLIKEIQKGAKK